MAASAEAPAVAAAAPGIAAAPIPVDPSKVDPAALVLAPEESTLPQEGDSEGWLELLRDGYYRQLREENEYKEPPPFHRAMQFAWSAASPGELCPETKYPRAALNFQMQMLMKLRPEPMKPGGKNFGKGVPMMGFGGMPFGMMQGMGSFNKGAGAKGGDKSKGKGGKGKDKGAPSKGGQKGTKK
eukprot:CAMPEP_0115120228 /NCGR_PEP_ID=MMETSP0227-20121206/45557_1 /TAXON_ID=89957 /ORGANISM="Polarella glacialis, Strain CCMP 1383" /LENGTH=183 /DNA_ID=CAMNT_0002521839 /DNA_START=71 /DNA_END=622 /DNA_ORIENTATION=+